MNDKIKEATKEYNLLIQGWLHGEFCLRELDNKITTLNAKYGTNFELILKLDEE